MLNDTPYYHAAIRNTIVAFGNMFSNIKFERKKGNKVEQTIQVPIAYAQKEKWVQAIEANPDSERGVQTSLPRLGFEITGYNYDATRKLGRMNSITCTTNDGKVQIYAPVPYNVDLQLYLATKTQEDALQVVEQVLPAFTPEYTVGVKSIAALNLVQDVPIILNNISVEDNYDGDLKERRLIVHTFSFTAKVNLFGPVNKIGVIKRVDVPVSTPDVKYTAIGTTPDQPISEEWMGDF
jgi:hypothetical protein